MTEPMLYDSSRESCPCELHPQTNKLPSRLPSDREASFGLTASSDVVFCVIVSSKVGDDLVTSCIIEAKGYFVS